MTNCELLVQLDILITAFTCFPSLYEMGGKSVGYKWTANYNEILEDGYRQMSNDQVSRMEKTST